MCINLLSAQLPFNVYLFFVLIELRKKKRRRFNELFVNHKQQNNVLCPGKV